LSSNSSAHLHGDHARQNQMNRNVLSSTEASELIRKLISDKVSVQATLFTSSGLKIRIKGFVDGMTDVAGLVVATESPASRSKGAWISVPVRNRTAVCLYADKRDFPEAEREQFAEEFGDTLLFFDFVDCQEKLALTFTL
jgi:hypothetical protein